MTLVLGRNRAQVFVSDWAGRAVLALDPRTLRVVATIPVGDDSNQLAIHPKDDRLFVACESKNCVSVIDTQCGIVTETIYTALFPRASEGSTPDAHGGPRRQDALRRQRRQQQLSGRLLGLRRRLKQLSRGTEQEFYGGILERRRQEAVDDQVP